MNYDESVPATNIVQSILENYESDNVETKIQLQRILMAGSLSGTGKLVILPVDQGFEHGPDRSFSINPDSYDPHYHYKLAIDAGMSAYAAPIGMLESGVKSFTDNSGWPKIPLICFSFPFFQLFALVSKYFYPLQAYNHLLPFPLIDTYCHIRS